MKCKDLKFNELRGQRSSFVKGTKLGCFRKRWSQMYAQTQEVERVMILQALDSSGICLGDGGVWLGALRIKSCLNSATYFICASRAGERGFCAWVRETWRQGWQATDSGKRPVLVIAVSLMQMNAISGSPQQHYLRWQGEYNPTS